MVADSVFIEIVLVASALLNAVVIYPVYRKLQARERTNMASFQLNAEKVFTDFKILFAAAFMFLVATSTLFYGKFIGNGGMFLFGNLLSMASSFVPLVVFFRWWRRFR